MHITEKPQFREVSYFKILLQALTLYHNHQCARSDVKLGFVYAIKIVQALPHKNQVCIFLCF